MSAAINGEKYMMIPESSNNADSLFYNQNGQPFIYEPSTANFEEVLRSQLTQQINSANINKSIQAPSINKVKN